MDGPVCMECVEDAGEFCKSFVSFCEGLGVDVDGLFGKMIYRERDDAVGTSSSPYSCSAINANKAAKAIQDPELERSIYGSWNRGRGLKARGLMKKVMQRPTF